MFVYEKYDFSLFLSRFEDYNRQSDYSYTGLKALYNYLEMLAAETGEPVELDVIALCCDFNEIRIDEIKTETGFDSLEELEENTIVINVDKDSIIYQAI